MKQWERSPGKWGKNKNPVSCLFHDSSKWVSKSGTNSQSTSQAFGIHALVILLLFFCCTHFSGGMTRMETRSTWALIFLTVLFTLGEKKCKAALTWFTFQALVEVSGLIFMDVRSPLGIVTTFR